MALCLLNHAAELLFVKQRRNIAKQFAARFILFFAVAEKLCELTEFHNRFVITGFQLIQRHIYDENNFLPEMIKCDYFIKEHQINISMTQCGDPLHNALAERMNNTIKNGWLFDCDDESFEQVSKRIEDAVYVYNHVRPHQGINMRTPMEVVSETGGLTA